MQQGLAWHMNIMSMSRSMTATSAGLLPLKDLTCWLVHMPLPVSVSQGMCTLQVPLGYHADNSDIVFLACRSKAKTGGQCHPSVLTFVKPRHMYKFHCTWTAADWRGWQQDHCCSDSICNKRLDALICSRHNESNISHGWFPISAEDSSALIDCFAYSQARAAA